VAELKRRAEASPGVEFYLLSMSYFGTAYTVSESRGLPEYPNVIMQKRHFVPLSRYTGKLPTPRGWMKPQDMEQK
jgi:hypothetical protein